MARLCSSRVALAGRAWPAICTADFIGTVADYLEAQLRASLVNPTPVQTLMRQIVAVQGFDALDRLGQIEAPTLVVHGDADLLVPLANGRALNKAIPGSQLQIIAGAGHMFFWEKPRESAETVAGFLSTLPVAA